MKTFCLILFIFIANFSYTRAQQLRMERIEQTNSAQTSNESFVRDNNGDPCAMLKIYYYGKEPIFEGNIVGDAIKTDEYYTVHLISGSKMLRIGQAGVIPIEIRFSDYGFPSVKGGSMYTLIFMENATMNQTNQGSTIVWNEKIANSQEILATMQEAKSLYMQKRPIESYQNFLKAALFGHIPAIEQVTSMMGNLFGTDEDKTNLLPIILAAAKNGQARAISALGNFYENGWGGLDKSYYMAAKYYKKAADMGDSYGICALGELYQYGHGVALDKKNAFELYNLSDKNGKYYGKLNLAECYLYGLEGAVEKDYTKALNLYTELQKEELVNPVVYLRLSDMYYNGYGVRADAKRALELMEKAAQLTNNHHYCLHCLAYYYEHGGSGLTVNIEKALDLYNKAAAQGDQYSQTRLAIAYYHAELGQKEDNKKSLDLFIKAANNTSPQAWVTSFIGYIYEHGLAGERNRDLARQWYQKGVELGENSYKEDIKRLDYYLNHIAKDGEYTSDNYRGHQYVDLGLPSGTMWATCNVGATTPYAYGDYYAWGETKTKNRYAKDNYSIVKQYYLPNENDVASMQWGGAWHIPTRDDFKELVDNCKFELITKNGLDVCKITSSINNKFIILPAAHKILEGETFDKKNMYCMYNTSNYAGRISDYYEAFGLWWRGGFTVANIECHAGTPIRPVFYVK